MGARLGEVVGGIGLTNISPVVPYESIVDNSVTSPTQDLFIKIPSIDQGRTVKGPCRWTPMSGPSGLIYPTIGDLALSVRSQEGFYWVTEFIPASYPSAVDMATQAELDVEKARIAALEGLTPRFLSASDANLRQTASTTVAEMTSALRLVVPPTLGTWEFDMEFQWETGTANTRINFELWDISGPTNLGSARGSLFSSASGRNVRASFRAFISAATFGVSNRTMTMAFSSPDAATASVRGDVTPTSFVAIEHR